MIEQFCENWRTAIQVTFQNSVRLLEEFKIYEITITHLVNAGLYISAILPPITFDIRFHSQPGG